MIKSIFSVLVVISIIYYTIKRYGKKIFRRMRRWRKNSSENIQKDLAIRTWICQVLRGSSIGIIRVILLQ